MKDESEFPKRIARVLHHNPHRQQGGDTHGTLKWMETKGNRAGTIVYQDTRGDQVKTDFFVRKLRSTVTHTDLNGKLN